MEDKDRTSSHRDGTSAAAPLVSILTPSLNQAARLRGAIESVLGQTYRHIEYIVIDGGSNDGSIDILKSFERTHQLRWISEPDNGMYHALNKGLRLVSGEILGYLNTDDRYFPYTVETAVSALIQHPELGFIYGDILNFDESKSRGGIRFYPPFNSSYLAQRGIISQPAVFWRRAVVDSLGDFDEAYGLAADMEYWIRASQHFCAEHVEEVLALEGQHTRRLTYGEAAERQALHELAAIRDTYGDLDSKRFSGVTGTMWEAFSYRASAYRFIWSTLRSSTGAPGRAWQGFLQVDEFRIEMWRLLLATVPYLGRKYKEFIVR